MLFCLSLCRWMISLAINIFTIKSIYIFRIDSSFLLYSKHVFVVIHKIVVRFSNIVGLLHLKNRNKFDLISLQSFQLSKFPFSIDLFVPSTLKAPSPIWKLARLAISKHSASRFKVCEAKTSACWMLTSAKAYDSSPTSFE